MSWYPILPKIARVSPWKLSDLVFLAMIAAAGCLERRPAGNGPAANRRLPGCHPPADKQIENVRPPCGIFGETGRT